MAAPNESGGLLPDPRVIADRINRLNEELRITRRLLRVSTAAVRANRTDLVDSEFVAESRQPGREGDRAG